MCVKHLLQCDCFYAVKNHTFGLVLDLNQLEVRPSLQRVVIENNLDAKLVVRKVEDLSDNVLVTGPRYQPDDIKCRFCANHGRFTSGVIGK